MPRIILQALMCVCLCLSAFACAPAPHSLPRHFKIDDSFSAEKQSMILEMAAQWNDVGRDYLGIQSVLVYDGLFHSRGFDYETDLNDGTSVIYRITDETPFAKNVNLGHVLDGKGEPNGVMASAFDEDLVVFDAWMDKADAESRDSRFRRFLVHELGHFLGIPVELNEYEPAACVIDDPNGPVMCATWFSGQFPSAIQPADIRLLCQAHSCQKQP